jgi:hypothetical protein
VLVTVPRVVRFGRFGPREPPHRALPGELPAFARRFRRVALVMLALVGGAFALGVVAGASVIA